MNENGPMTNQQPLAEATTPASTAGAQGTTDNGCVVVIGVFDGVHRGHRSIIRHAQDHAQRLKLPLVVLTFDPHPMAILRPAAAPRALATVEYRKRLLQSAGADAVVVIDFDADVAHLSPAAFVDDYLVKRLSARVVVVGENFRFGQRAAGAVADLQILGRDRGFTAEGLPLVADASGLIWSSTEIRSLVAAGDVTGAAEGLTRPHRVEGTVVLGDQRGRDLGFPTANLALPDNLAVPGSGVYAGWLVRDPYGAPAALPAAISVGNNATFGGTELRVEAFVLDADGWLELYDEFVAIDFVARLRGMEKYESVAALTAQMEQDVAAARVALQ